MNQFQGRLNRRYVALFVFACVFLLLWCSFPSPSSTTSKGSKAASNYKTVDSFKYLPSTYDWSKAKPFFPVANIKSLPTGRAKRFPKIQAQQSAAAKAQDHISKSRRETIKTKFVKSWEAYKTYAWTKDELMPLSGKGKQTFSGWSAQLVDALDTLWIMGLKDDFRRAVKEVAVIDWAKTTDTRINMFEVNIRHLGGLLAAFELAAEPALLAKATELGDALYAAFDTPNGMPPGWYEYDKAKKGEQVADSSMSIAAGGSLCLEFTRLSQITGDAKYYDATERIKQFFYRVQNQTSIPGMWPHDVNYRELKLLDDESQRFTLGAGADSMYEYLPKMHALLGGLDPEYEEMTIGALNAVKDNVLYRPMTPTDANILMAGNVYAKNGKTSLTAEMEHLTCFSGGMYGLAGRLFSRDDFIDLGTRLTNGCVWAYEAFTTNIMPEISQLVACDTLTGPCKYSESSYPKGREKTLPEGFVRVRDSRYLLRPEAVESVFYMWRITGDQVWRDAAWRMFEGIVRETETEMAFAAVDDVKVHSSDKTDLMEVSFSAYSSMDER